jgi:hypothetical protein
MMACQLQLSYKSCKMNRKVTAAVITCMIAGIGIYLVSTRMRVRKVKKKKTGLQFAKPTSGYAFEYTL